MPSSTSISIKASPEIARFDGMVLHIFNKDDEQVAGASKEDA
jgi:hypothetical protein